MPRAPFPQELMKWLDKHVKAGDISRETANNLWWIAHKDFPKESFYSRRKGRPGAPSYAIDIPGLDVDHNICFGKAIIRQYLMTNPPKSALELARFATVLKDAGCWYKMDQAKYAPIKSMHRALTDVLTDMGMATLFYEPFTQALKEIEEGLEGSYPKSLRENDVNSFKAYLEQATEETRAKELPDDYPPDFL